MKIQHFKIIFYILILSRIIAFCANDNKQIVKDINILDTIQDKIIKARQLQRDSLVDWTDHSNNICEVHHYKMVKDTVPNIGHVTMDIDEILLWKPNRHPHGYKFVCANGGVTRAIIFTCSQCIKEIEAEDKKNNKEPIDSNKSK